MATSSNNISNTASWIWAIIVPAILILFACCTIVIFFCVKGKKGRRISRSNGFVTNQNYPGNISYVPPPTNSYPPMYPAMGSMYPQSMPVASNIYTPPPPYPSLPQSTNIAPIYPPMNGYNNPKF